MRSQRALKTSRIQFILDIAFVRKNKKQKTSRLVQTIFSVNRSRFLGYPRYGNNRSTGPISIPTGNKKRIGYSLKQKQRD